MLKIELWNYQRQLLSVLNDTERVYPNCLNRVKCAFLIT